MIWIAISFIAVGIFAVATAGYVSYMEEQGLVEVCESTCTEYIDDNTIPLEFPCDCHWEKKSTE